MHAVEICTCAMFRCVASVQLSDRPYLHARTNVIYELGWFCGKLGRGNVMLLFKEGTSTFSDFGCIIQKRFVSNVYEKIIDIRKDLEAAGVLLHA